MTQYGSEMGENGPEMGENERPLSEMFRLVAKEWVELDGAACLLEECKTAVLAQRMLALGGDKPVSHAEREVKASPEWTDYLTKMVEARSAAQASRSHCASGAMPS